MTIIIIIIIIVIAKREQHQTFATQNGTYPFECQKFHPIGIETERKKGKETNWKPEKKNEKGQRKWWKRVT